MNTILNRSPVLGVFSAGVDSSNDDEHMLELGADALRCEGQSSRLLKHNRHNVVADVPLAQKLKQYKTSVKNIIKL